jgi:hypothetical protein
MIVFFENPGLTAKSSSAGAGKRRRILSLPPFIDHKDVIAKKW